MKILLVNNGTSYLAGLKDLLLGLPFLTVNYGQLGAIDARDFDAIILSGGHDLPVRGSEKFFEKEMQLIRESQKPLLGICLGFELIASAFGLELELMDTKENGIINIKTSKYDPIFSGIESFKVFESHRWVVKETNEDLIALAYSKDGIEVIKHKTLPIYGVQFHPEMFVDQTCGEKIFRNFLKII